MVNKNFKYTYTTCWIKLIIIGSYIEVYGTIQAAGSNLAEPPRSQYVLDGTYTDIFQAPSMQSVAHRQRFYSSPPHLADGLHRLVISSLTDGPLLSLDFVQFIPSLPSNDIPKAASINAQQMTPAARAGTIAAGVIGGVAFIAVVILLLFLVRRRRYRAAPFLVEGVDSGPRSTDSAVNPSHIGQFSTLQIGPPLAWSSKSGNITLPTVRPRQPSQMSMEPPMYDLAVEQRISHQRYILQPNPYANPRSSVGYHASDFEVVPVIVST